MQSTLTTNKVITPIIALVSLIFVSLIFFSIRQTYQAKNAAALTAHTQQVLFQTAKVLATVAENETNSRGFIITGQQDFLDPLKRSKLNLVEEMAALRTLAKDDHKQQLRIDSLEFYASRRIAFSDSAVNTRKEAGLAAAIQLVSTGNGKVYMDKIRQIIKQVQEEETAVLVLRKTSAENATQQLQWIITTAVFIFIALIILFLTKNRLHVTAQRNAEKNLKASEDNFRLLTSGIKDYAIFMLDAAGNVASWNRSAEQIKGYRKEEIIGKSFEVFYTAAAIAKGEPAQLLEMARNNGQYETEGLRVRKDGSTFWANVVLSALKDDNGAIYGFAKITRDISERKKVQEELELLSLQINQSNEAIYTVNADTKIASWNRGAENLYGFTKEEAIGRDSNDLLKTIISPGQITEAIQKIAEQDYWTGELKRTTKNGDDLYVRTSTTAVRDEAGGISGYVAVSIDVTEQKNLLKAVSRMNEELEDKVRARTEDIKRSEARYRYLFENNPMPMWVIDLGTFRFLDVNDMAVVQYGYSREEFLSMTALDIRPEDDRNGFIKADHSFGMNNANYNRGTWRHKKKNGSIILVEIIAHEILFEGLPSRLILANDVTEKKEAEEKLIASEKQFHVALDTMLEGVQIIGFDWRYIYVNDAMAKHGKYNKEELIGHTVMEMYPGIEQTDIFKVYLQCFNERTAIHLENEFLFPDGSSAWFELSFQPVTEGIFILSVDITQRKQAEEKIKRLNIDLEDRVIKRTEQLKKTNEELEAFSYSVSHDLRAPLRAIIGFTAMLEEDYGDRLDNEGRRITSIIKNNTTKMGNLIDDLLSFSRMGRQGIIKASVDNQSLVKEITTDLSKGEHNGKTVNWIIHSLPASNADINTIRQVWINLLSNALKYSRKKTTPEIEIGSFKRDDEIIFFVKDNGVGFDERYKNKLFKVFQRLHSSEEFEGTGIGLAIVEKIILKHGGRVWADAEVDKGASFYFSLPEN
jgi:PAS domain S-box-containing protein